MTIIKDTLKFIKLFFQYNWGKMILVFLTITSINLFMSVEAITTNKNIDDVLEYGKEVYYIHEYDNGDGIQSFINHKDINIELNKLKQGEILKKGDVLIDEYTNPLTILLFISILGFGIGFIGSLFKYGDFEGFGLSEIKIEIFSDKIKSYYNLDGDYRTTYVYKNRVLYLSGMHDTYQSNSTLYREYKFRNFNTLPIFINKSEDGNKDKEIVRNKVKGKEEKLKEIMKLLDD